MRTVLIGCAHGTSDPDGRAVVQALLDRVAVARPEYDVRPAFVDVQEPRVGEVVAQALAERAGGPVVVVPLLLSGGYHVHVDIAAATSADGVVAAGPMGPDPRLVDILAVRLRQAGALDADAVVLAAAGSSDPRAAGDVEAVARGLAVRRGGPVTVGYGAGCRPRVADAVAQARRGGRRVVVASYLLAPGYFHDRLQEAGADLVTAPLGADDRLAGIVLDRCQEALQLTSVPA